MEAVYLFAGFIIIQLLIYVIMVVIVKFDKKKEGTKKNPPRFVLGKFSDKDSTDTSKR